MNVLLTAFGPFGKYASNPSEEILHILLDLLKQDIIDVNFYSDVLDVSYSAVDRFWDIENRDFDFIFHMGVTSREEKINVELSAKNYTKGTDVDQVHREGLIDSETDQILLPSKRLSDDCHEYIKSSESLIASYDAGNYLCNYIFYKSLLKFGNQAPVLFLHVNDFRHNTNSANKFIQASELFKLIKHLILRKKADFPV
jgi:pyrrolidone-carboxylate peptidase